jgi:hypothetical protein
MDRLLKGSLTKKPRLKGRIVTSGSIRNNNFTIIKPVCLWYTLLGERKWKSEMKSCNKQNKTKTEIMKNTAQKTNLYPTLSNK